MSNTKPIGSDFDVGLRCKQVIAGYSALKIKYQKPKVGRTPGVEDFLNAVAYQASGALKIKAAVTGELWDTKGEWSFITWIEFADGRILKGEKPFIVECTSEF